MFGEKLGGAFGGSEEPASSGTFVDAVLNAAGTSTVSFASPVTVDAALNAAGTGSFAPVGESSASAAFDMSGSSSASFVAQRRWVARCEGAYTYDPLGGPEWDGTLRRDPEIVVQTQSSDSPSQSTFTDEVEPALGQNVQLDMHDGHGIILGGTVQSYVTRYLGQPDGGDHLVFDTTVADYQFLLNSRRPFGCFTDVSASVVAQALLDGYAPPDFSGAGIVPGLPNITVSFDGSLDFSGCMALICSRIAGHSRVDNDKVLHLFLDDPAPGPQTIDDSNMLLIRDQPLTISRDTSQLRNRVFVKGDGARLMADSAIGADQIEIDGLDIFNPAGGEGIIGCDRFTYGGVLKSLVYPPPDASQQTLGSPTSRQLQPGGLFVSGPIRTEVRYSAAMVFGGKEGARRTPLQTNIFRVNPSMGSSATFLPFAGFLPTGNHTWLFGFRSSDGGVYYNLNGASFSAVATSLGAMDITVTLGIVSNDHRPSTVVLWRKADPPDGDPGPAGTTSGWFYEAASQPYVPGVSSYDFTDGKDDDSLGNAAPWDEGLYTFQIYDTMGSTVAVTTLAARNSAFAAGAAQVKIYREEKYNGLIDTTAWTTPQVAMSFATTAAVPSGDPAEHEDTKSTTAHLYATGEEANNESPDVPPPPKPKLRLVLFGVSGLDEAHLDGESVNIFLQLDDLPSQVAAAQREGGNGLHEYMVSDGNLRSDAELQARGEAELTLFKDPIVTVSYSSFDPTHAPGGTVEFNLTRPPLVASLKVTEVRIDKVHYEHGHVARYNVTASSVKFTLQDLLRRTILRPY